MDLQKFKSENIGQKLENEIGYSNDKKIAARISLKNLGNGMNYDDVFYRKDLYEQKKVLVDAGFTKGPGGAKSSAKTSYVLIKDNNLISKGLLTIDMVMPDMSGLEFLEEVKKNKYSPEAAIIVLSNQSQTSDIHKAIEIGIDGYVVKATTIPSEVVAEVEKIMKEKFGEKRASVAA